MSSELNYNLKFSLAFYVELLFVKICKDVKLKGDFQLININENCDNNETVRFYL